MNRQTCFRGPGYGARLFRRQPGITLLAVLTLSLGIGADAVICSVLHAALIRPLPFPGADRLVAAVENFMTEGHSDVSPTIPELLDVRAASRTLDPISFFDMRDAQISGGAEPARAVSARVEADSLRTLGADPALGRIFTPGDHAPGHDRTVILSDAFWRRKAPGHDESARRHPPRARDDRRGWIRPAPRRRTGTKSAVKGNRRVPGRQTDPVLDSHDRTRGGAAQHR